jgi:hypothetical protein
MDSLVPTTVIVPVMLGIKGVRLGKILRQNDGGGS